MQAKELNSISITPLVVAPFSTEWSEDDHVSLITEKGVHVFELIPSPTCPHPMFKFSRSFIYPSAILPAERFASDVDSVLWKLNREQLYTLMMEEALTPRIDGIADMVPRIIGVAWSPRRLMHPRRCLLAIATSSGAIEILFKVSKDWHSASDLSAVRFNTIRRDTNFQFIRDMNAEEQYTALRKCVTRVQATSIAWSNLHETADARYAYLITAYRSADIVIWHVPAMKHPSHDLSPSIVFEANMETDAKINLLKWIDLENNKFLIVIGYFNGRVDGIILAPIKEKFTELSRKEYWAHADRIPVSCIELWKHYESSTRIIVTKGSFLILLDLTMEGILKDTRHIQMAGFSISGLVGVNNRQVMITTQNGGLYTVTLVNNHLVSKAISHDLQRSHVQYLGISGSLNRAMFLNITSPDRMYDHLINREPSTLYMFTLDGDEWDPLNVLKQNENKLLTTHWDCLEALRIKVAKTQNPYQILPSVPHDLEALSNYELRIVMWLSVIAEVCGKKKVPRKTENIVGEISEAHPLLFSRLASARLIDLASKEILTKEQRRSVSLLRSYVEVYLAGEEDAEETATIREAKKALSMTSHIISTAPECCELCGEIITDVAWKVTSCPSGHKLPRCAITLLQISTVHYRTCPICGQILHPSLDEEFKESLCPFCEVAALYDCRVLDVRDEAGLPIRSLSERPLSALQTAKFNNAEKRASENSKEQSTTTRTLAVIVDNTEDERYSITETWEQF